MWTHSLDFSFIEILLIHLSHIPCLKNDKTDFLDLFPVILIYFNNQSDILLCIICFDSILNPIKNHVKIETCSASSRI